MAGVYRSGTSLGAGKIPGLLLAGELHTTEIVEPPMHADERRRHRRASAFIGGFKRLDYFFRISAAGSAGSRDTSKGPRSFCAVSSRIEGMCSLLPANRFFFGSGVYKRTNPLTTCRGSIERFVSS